MFVEYPSDTDIRGVGTSCIRKSRDATCHLFFDKAAESEDSDIAVA